ncbi:hypothetical protein GCM10022228_13580 [Halomonas cibimaris]|uniref:Uncharacterized protein n=1 Tax=Halomonas cibimaris TaxID=657012 RepID=A0ABP7LNU3_9GAMM
MSASRTESYRGSEHLIHLMLAMPQSFLKWMHLQWCANMRRLEIPPMKHQGARANMKRSSYSRFAR